jgi:hypothetical protein
MVREATRACSSAVLTRHRTSEYYDDVLGAKIKSLVHASFHTMVLTHPAVANHNRAIEYDCHRGHSISLSVYPINISFRMPVFYDFRVSTTRVKAILKQRPENIDFCRALAS